MALHSHKNKRRFKNNNLPSKMILNNYEIMQLKQFIQDLEILTANPNQTASSLQSAIYRQESNRFSNKLAEYHAKWQKVLKELEMADTLVKAGVVAP